MRHTARALDLSRRGRWVPCQFAARNGAARGGFGGQDLRWSSAAALAARWVEEEAHGGSADAARRWPARSNCAALGAERADECRPRSDSGRRARELRAQAAARGATGRSSSAIPAAPRARSLTGARVARGATRGAGEEERARPAASDDADARARRRASSRGCAAGRTACSTARWRDARRAPKRARRRRGRRARRTRKSMHEVTSLFDVDDGVECDQAAAVTGSARRATARARAGSPTTPRGRARPTTYRWLAPARDATPRASERVAAAGAAASPPPTQQPHSASAGASARYGAHGAPGLARHRAPRGGGGFSA